MLEHLSAGTNTIISNCINLKNVQRYEEKIISGELFVLKAFCLNTYLEFNVFLYGCYS